MRLCSNFASYINVRLPLVSSLFSGMDGLQTMGAFFHDGSVVWGIPRADLCDRLMEGENAATAANHPTTRATRSMCLYELPNTLYTWFNSGTSSPSKLHRLQVVLQTNWAEFERGHARCIYAEKDEQLHVNDATGVH